MKIYRLLFVVLFFSCWPLYAATTNGTTVIIKGQIKAAACIVNAGSPDLSVNMPPYSANKFRAPGEVSDTSSPFQIMLTRCPLTTQSVKVKFDGASSNGYLTLDASSKGGGIGIAIYDSTNKLIPLGSQSDAYPIDAITGFATLSFFARYVALTLPVQPGMVQATATFTLNYF
ncbi:MULTISPECIES: fimbrial protein [Enterobacterales]|uniref:fimbrial protein n=1 Tax=Enterobacterales TaxID=91347 RepID=UPI002ED95747